MDNIMVAQNGSKNSTNDGGVNSLALSKEEVAKYLKEIFPQANAYNLNVEKLANGKAIVSMVTDDTHLRPGNTVSGPTLFALADVACYVLILAHIGKVALAVTTNININFLNKPNAGVLTAHTSILKHGKRLIVCDVQIFSNKILVAHATATYSIPAK